MTALILPTSLLGAIAAGVAVPAILHIWRRAITTLRRFSNVVDVIEAFGKQWAEAVRLDETIRASRSELQELMIQLGTQGRNPEWASLEAYLHELRHELRGDRARFNLATSAILRHLEEHDHHDHEPPVQTP